MDGSGQLQTVMKKGASRHLAVFVNSWAQIWFLMQTGTWACKSALKQKYLTVRKHFPMKVANFLSQNLLPLKPRARFLLTSEDARIETQLQQKYSWGCLGLGVCMGGLFFLNTHQFKNQTNKHTPHKHNRVTYGTAHQLEDHSVIGMDLKKVISTIFSQHEVSKTFTSSYFL